MPQRKRTYRVELHASVPLELNDEDGVEYPQYTARELEKHLIRVLGKAEPVIDLEVLDHADTEDD